MDIIIGIVYTLIIILVGMGLGAFITFYKVFRKLKKEEDLEDLEDEIEYTCCNIEITGEIRDYGLCPKCQEHL
tara:strand:+ start:11955 stop:12173 length:219 start_codon:yes stop_codon:yes gene_type:complete